MINLTNLSFSYGGSKEPALNNISLRISSGEFVLLVGSSGSGKSTLCRVLNGLVPHFHGGRISGSVMVDGMDVLKTPTRVLSGSVGLVFQDPENQFIMNDAEAELAFGLENMGLDRSEMQERISEVLDRFGLHGLRNRSPDELSGGEKQRVAIASVVAMKPKILVLDEPTSELDPWSAGEVLDFIHKINEDLGITIILTEHRLSRVLDRVDRMVFMENGKIAKDGSPKEVLPYMWERNSGVGVPPVVELFLKLGLKIPLTVDEAVSLADKIRDRFGNKKITRKKGGRTAGEVIVQLNGVRYSYDGASNALDGIDLEVRTGELLAVIGKNGSGKTTLVKHFNGLIKPDSGEVFVNGKTTRNASVAELSRTVGMVFQNPNLHLFEDSVEAELSFILKNLGKNKKEKTEEYLRKFGLENLRQSYPRDLSGGEKQRLAIASIFVSEPQVLVLDEPTRGMDYSSKRHLMGLLAEYAKAGNSVVLVSHDIEAVAGFSDRVVLLEDGRIIADGPTNGVLSGSPVFSTQINRFVRRLGKSGNNVDENILTLNELLQ